MPRRKRQPATATTARTGTGAGSGADLASANASANASAGTGADLASANASADLASANANASAGTGAADNQPEGTTAALFEVDAVTTETEEQRKERARKAHRRYRPREAKGEVKANPDAATAAVLFAMLDGLIVSQLGAAAAMQEYERAMIEPPLVRILGRMTPDQRAAVEKYSDPVMLVWGLAVYGARVYRIAADRQAEANPPALSPADLQPETQPAARPLFQAAPSDDIGIATAPAADILAAVNGGAGVTLR